MITSASRLTITLTSATGLDNKAWVGLQNPYAIVQCGHHTFQSKAVKHGGTNPVFNETFSFEIVDEDTIDVTLRDGEILHDEFLGKGEISLKNLRKLGQEDQVVKLYNKKGEEHGQLNVQMEYRANIRPATEAELREEKLREERRAESREGYV